MSQISDNAEKYIWNNFKMYLFQYHTCFLDNILKIKDEKAVYPIDRYDDFINSFEKHIGLGSYTAGQAAQFSNVPYVTVNIQAHPMSGCTTHVVMSFDVLFTTDSPRPDRLDSTQYVGNSSEAVASFRANIANGLRDIMQTAYDPETVDGASPRVAFFDRLRDQTIPNPANIDETRDWEYNVVGFVDDDSYISEVIQLKKEDRSSGLLLFTITYTMDVNRLYGNGIDCGC